MTSRPPIFHIKSFKHKKVMNKQKTAMAGELTAPTSKYLSPHYGSSSRERTDSNDTEGYWQGFNQPNGGDLK